MTSETLTPDQTQALRAAIPKIEQAGGPKWYPWCELFKHKMPYGPQDWTEELRIWSMDECDAVYCPPAVAAAVIAWSEDVRAWWSMEKGGSHMHIQPAYQGRWESWWGGSGESVMHESRLAASVALIEAVAGEVGDE
jgi:hypothetical protein